MSNTINRLARVYFNEPLEEASSAESIAPARQSPVSSEQVSNSQPPNNAIVDGMLAKLYFFQKSNIPLAPQRSSAVSSSESARPVTQQQLENISPAFKKLSDADKKAIVDQLNLAMELAGITDLRDRAVFIAQVAQETNGFTEFSEKASKFKSSQSFYKGRGPLQLTGKNNYRDFAQKLGGVTVQKNGTVKLSPPLSGTDRAKLSEQIYKATHGRVDARPILEKLDKARENYVKIDNELYIAQQTLKNEAARLKNVQSGASMAANKELTEAQNRLRAAKQERLKAKTPEDIASADKRLAAAKSGLDAATSKVNNLKSGLSAEVKQARQRVQEAQQRVEQLKQSKTQALNELKNINSDWISVIMNNPEVVANSSYIGALSAAYFWKENGIGKILNARRGDEEDAFRAVSAKINTGKESSRASSINGLNQRKHYYEKTKQELGVK